ncbi:hypothetical protein D3C87_1638150 [compost metagenome]
MLYYDKRRCCYSNQAKHNRTQPINRHARGREETSKNGFGIINRQYEGRQYEGKECRTDVIDFWLVGMPQGRTENSNDNESGDPNWNIDIECPTPVGCHAK